MGWQELLVQSGQRGQVMRYRLHYEGEGDASPSAVLGLAQKGSVDVELSGLNAKLSDQERDLSGSNRPQIGGVSGPNRPPQNGLKPTNGVASEVIDPTLAPKRIVLDKKNSPPTRPGV